MKKIFSFSLILILLLCVLAPITCSAEPIKKGDIHTSFDETTGTLTVWGLGIVEDLYNCCNGKPDEKDFDNKVKHIVIGDGITIIQHSFNGLNALEDITFPSSPSTLRSIYNSFAFCNNLESVTIPDTISLLYNSFWYCDKLKYVTFNGKIDLFCCFFDAPIEEIFIPRGSNVSDSFNGCKNLTKVILDQNVHVAGFSYYDDDLIQSWAFDECNENLVIYAATTKDDTADIQTPLDTTLPPKLPDGVESVYEDLYPPAETTDEELAEQQALRDKQQALRDKQELKLMTNSLNIVLICLISSAAFNAVLFIVLVVKRRKKHIATET